MPKQKKDLRGIPALYRSNFIDAMAFGAIQFQMINQPDTKLDEIVQSVIKTFGLEMSPGALKTSFIRTRATFVHGNNNNI